MNTIANANATATVNPKNGRPSGMIAQEVYDVIMANAEKLNSSVIYDRDFSYVGHSCISPCKPMPGMIRVLTKMAKRHRTTLDSKLLNDLIYYESMVKLLNDLNICSCESPLEFTGLILIESSKRTT